MTKLEVIKCDCCDKIIEDGSLLISFRLEAPYAEDVSTCNIYLSYKEGKERCVNSTRDRADFCSKACFVKYITMGL